MSETDTEVSNDEWRMETATSYFNDGLRGYTSFVNQEINGPGSYGINRNETYKDTSLMIEMSDIPFTNFAFVSYPESTVSDGVASHGIIFSDGSNPNLIEKLTASGGNVRMQFRDGEGDHYFDDVQVEEYYRFALNQEKTRTVVLWKSLGYSKY